MAPNRQSVPHVPFGPTSWRLRLGCGGARRFAGHRRVSMVGYKTRSDQLPLLTWLLLVMTITTSSVLEAPSSSVTVRTTLLVPRRSLGLIETPLPRTLPLSRQT